MSAIPIIDISVLRHAKTDHAALKYLAESVREACTVHGFFYVAGHGVDQRLLADLEMQSHAFFNLPEAEKMELAMHKGGKAWRGYFPVGAELTSGLPDQKEGIYFGTELHQDHPSVKAGVPMHGANLFPTRPEAYRQTVLDYMAEATRVGHTVMQAISLSLGLPADHFHERYTHDPLILFRIFHYPAQPHATEGWGVGEHTDYGLLTILLQDSVGGLQVKSAGSWTEAPPIAGTFVCNIGDMLDRMTGGLYRSTPHRVRNATGRSRLSFPLFFDPGFDTRVQRIEGMEPRHDDRDERWDKASVHDFEGTYGEYLLRKVGNVFPQLRQQML
jgi:isopenicillin N synthase-like dioxygenase